MISQEENDLLTRTDPGTLCGDLIRRYWQPAALSEELPPGGSPLPVRLLGEDLVLFRDDQGRPGLLGIHCSHRGADLSYGRVEDGGLRCIYHGWLYDIHGQCLDQPGEPGGGSPRGELAPVETIQLGRAFTPRGGHRESIRHPAYPCQEAAGVIFAYLGPGDRPLLPAYEFLNAPAHYSVVTKYFHECNYLQSNEGNIDPVHLSFLHRNLEQSERDRNRQVRGTTSSTNTLYGKDLAPNIEVELTDFGVRISTLRKSDDDTKYLRISNFILPNLSAFPGPTGGEGYSVNWHVPIDDTHHWKFVFSFSRERPVSDQLLSREGSHRTSDYKLIRNRDNRYMQDRDELRTKTYTGLGRHFPTHDAYATESQGPIQGRTQEHVVSSDKAIVAARKQLLQAMKDVQEGKDPPHVVRDPKLNRFSHLVVISEVIPSEVDWKDHAKKAVDRLKA